MGRVERVMEKYPREFAQMAKGELKRAGILWQRIVVKEFRGYTGTRGRRLQNRTGNLRRTIVYKQQGSTVDNMALLLRAGGKIAPYARTQEEGRVIRAKDGGYLAIPLPDALTVAGDLKARGIIRKAGKRYYSGFGQTFIYKSRKGNLIVAARYGTRLMNLRVLKKQVTVPGPKSDGSRSKLGAQNAADNVLRDTLLPRIKKGAIEVWRDA